MWPNPEQTVVFQFLIFFFQAQVYFCVRPLRAFFVHFPVFWAHLAIFVICVSIRECRFELFLYFLLRGEYRVEPDAGHPSPVGHRGEHDLLKIEMSLHGVHIKGPETGVAHTQKFLFCLPANFFGKTYRPSSFPHVFSLKIIQKLSPALKKHQNIIARPVFNIKISEIVQSLIPIIFCTTGIMASKHVTFQGREFIFFGRDRFVIDNYVWGRWFYKFSNFGDIFWA